MSVSPISLESGINQLGLQPDEEKIRKLDLFMDLLLKWNKVYNLTSITRKEEIVTKHILDSLAIVKYLREFCPTDGSILDAGSGAGIPGIPCAIFCPDRKFTLVDSVRKKVAFQIQATGALKLTNVHPLHARLESKSIGEGFNVIISRAFSSLKDFTEITSHLTVNGTWLALKANLAKDEQEALSKQFVIKEIIPLTVPGLTGTRTLVVIQRAYQ